MTTRYASVLPSGMNPNGYNPSDQIQFIVDIPTGKKVLGGSWKISGTLASFVAGTPPANAVALTLGSNAACDPLSGAHGLFSRWITEKDGMNLEMVDYQARFVRHLAECRQSFAEKLDSAEQRAAGCGASLSDTAKWLIGDAGNTCPHANGILGASFCIRPNFVLNTVQGLLPSGRYVITTSLNSATAFYCMGELPGLNNAAAVFVQPSFLVESDLALSWTEVADASPAEPAKGIALTVMREAISSSRIGSLVTPATPAISITQSLGLLNAAAGANGFASIPISPSMWVQCLYTIGGTDRAISFPLRDVREAEYNGVKALGGKNTATGSSSLSELASAAQGKGTVWGLSFGGLDGVQSIATDLAFSGNVPAVGGNTGWALYSFFQHPIVF